MKKQYKIPLGYTGSFHVSNYLISKDDSISMFRNLLSRAIYGGSIISDYFWHPVFPPKFQGAKTVNELFEGISAIWNGLRSDNHTLCTDAFWNIEISHLLEAYEYAARSNTGLVILPPVSREQDEKPGRSTREWPVYPALIMTLARPTARQEGERAATNIFGP